MKVRHLVFPLALIAALGGLGGIRALAQEGGPPPTAGKVLATGLKGTIGATVGPDGALYVAEGGNSGSQRVTTPNGDGYFGLSGRITRIDPATGARTTAATGIPSGAQTANGDGFGVSDVAFLDGEMYYLVTGSFNLLSGLEKYPNGVYHVNHDGSSTLVANVSKFNDDHPVTFPDAGPGGNPFGLTVRDGDFYMTDGNYNRVLHITRNGVINLVSSFDNVVTTGIAGRSGGPLIVTEFGAFPFEPSSGKVIQVGVPTGTQVELASGVSHIISAAYGPDGKLYALSMGDQASPDSGDEAAPFTGKILRVNGDGTFTTIVDRLMLATLLDFSGDIAYVTSLTGMVYQVENFLAVQPPAPTPTAAPRPPAVPTPPGGIQAPDTGSGPAGGDASAWLFAALAALAVGALAAVSGVVMRRR